MTRSHIEIYDNGGASIDRYTAVEINVKPRVDQGMEYYPAFSLSANPLSSTGVCQYIEVVRGEHLGERIAMRDLPKDCQIILKN